MIGCFCLLPLSHSCSVCSTWAHKMHHVLHAACDFVRCTFFLQCVLLRGLTPKTHEIHVVFVKYTIRAPEHKYFRIARTFKTNRMGLSRDLGTGKHNRNMGLAGLLQTRRFQKPEVAINLVWKNPLGPLGPCGSKGQSQCKLPTQFALTMAIISCQVSGRGPRAHRAPRPIGAPKGINDAYIRK